MSDGRNVKYRVVSGVSGGEQDYQSKRIRVTKFFVDDEYIFSVNENVRGYVWKKSQGETLFESILEKREQGKPALDLGSMVFVIEQNHSGYIHRGSSQESTEPSRNLGHSCRVLKVYDGQQRLITLSLLIAAMAKEFTKVKDTYFANKAKEWIYPATYQDTRVTRIGSNRQEDNFLENILSDPCAYVFPEPGIRKRLPLSAKCILDMHEYFLEVLAEQVAGKGKGILREIWECIKDKIYVVQCVPPDDTQAITMVMHQHKAIDLFRAHVCLTAYGPVRKELAGAFNDLETQVSRDIMQMAVLYLAQAHKGKFVGNFREVELVGDYVEGYFQSNPSADAKDLFANEVKPASMLLSDFRNHQAYLPTHHNAAQASLDESHASLEFLLFASKRMKEIEVIVLIFLKWYGEVATMTTSATATEATAAAMEDVAENNQTIAKRKLLKMWLKKLESVALWALVTKPNCSDRRDRCLKILKPAGMVITDQSNADIKFLSKEQEEALFKRLDNLQIDISNDSDRALVRAILQRLERHTLIHCNGGTIETDPIQSTRTTAESILHKDEAGQWQCRLGNFFLDVWRPRLKKKRPGNRFENSIFSLTKELSEIATWDRSALETHHKKLHSLAKEVWSLYPTEPESDETAEPPQKKEKTEYY